MPGARPGGERESDERIGNLDVAPITWLVASVWIGATGTAAFVLPTALAAPVDEWSVTAEPGRLVVREGSELVAAYDYQSYAKPILFPLLAPGGIRVTRGYPMEPEIPGEPRDHPHHKSVWLAHGAVNGVDFWTEKGRIAQSAVVEVSGPGPRAWFTVENVWSDGDQVVCTDRTTWSFQSLEGARAADIEFTLIASHGRVTLGDTKEGTFAVRVVPGLQLESDAAQGVQAAGHAVNSEGLADAAIWGQRARWVYYHGQIDGQPVGLAMIDHPVNLRHPTTWHARPYGLVAANPFGLHDFTGAPAGTGDVVVDDGETLTLRYRIFVHRGAQDTEAVERAFEHFSRQ